VSEDISSLPIGNLCACMGPQATDPYCPCRMRSQGIDGYYNCNGDKVAHAKRCEEDRSRLLAAMSRFADRQDITGGGV
jgi:hypothetical protein